VSTTRHLSKTLNAVARPGGVSCDMPIGTVKWFNNKKGYGFITLDGPEKEQVFVHHSVIHMSGYKTLFCGQRVEFELFYGPKGLSACEVKPLSVIAPARPQGGGHRRHSG